MAPSSICTRTSIRSSMRRDHERQGGLQQSALCRFEFVPGQFDVGEDVHRQQLVVHVSRDDQLDVGAPMAARKMEIRPVVQDPRGTGDIQERRREFAGMVA